MSQMPPSNSPFGAPGNQNPFGDQQQQPPGAYPAGPQPPYNPYLPSGHVDGGGNDPALRYIVPVDTSVWAILSGYCGLVSPVFCFCGPLAILFGVLGIRNIKQNPQVHGYGRCIFGIIMGTLGSLFLLGFLISLLAGAFH